MIFRTILLVFFVTLALSGCGELNKKPEPTLAGAGEPSQQAQDPSASPASPATPKLFDIGDVETHVHFTVTPSQESLPAQVKVNVMESHGRGISLVTVDVSPPYPQELWLDCTLRASRSFKGQPVTFRGMFLRDEDIIGDISGVFGIDQGATVSNLETERLDAFLGLAELSGSLLIHGEAEVFLLPPGTDAASLDPFSADSQAEAKSVMLSNPVRINFIEE